MFFKLLSKCHSKPLYYQVPMLCLSSDTDVAAATAEASAGAAVTAGASTGPALITMFTMVSSETAAEAVAGAASPAKAPVAATASR